MYFDVAVNLFLEKKTNVFWFIAGTPGEPPTEEERRQQMAYEQWMDQHSQWLNINIKHGENHMAKFRKTKKSLNAKSRQVWVIDQNKVAD